MWDWLSKLTELKNQGVPVAMVTVIECTGSTPREPGAKMLVTADGRFFGTIGGGHLEEIALVDARKCLEEGVTKTIRYPLGAKTGQCCGGTMELFYEVLNTGPRLYLFGAGHVGQAVCKTLSGTPFVVHVIDEREEWINSPELPREAIRHHCEWDDFVPEAAWDNERTYVAIMTHRHDTDQDIVEDVIKRPARYLGLIGSRGKWARFQQRLTTQGVEEARLARVRCPLGLDTGGKSPQEVAISVAAELLQIHYGKNT